MNNQHLVSIITPCYNGETFLDNYFASVLSQTYDNLELIFVNDGSTDRTEEIALSYRQALEERGIIYKYLHQPNGGQANAMNTGFQEMTGTYLVWPDSDDLLSPDSIEKRVAFLERHPDFGMVRSNADALDWETKERRYRFSEHPNRFREDIFLDLILEETYCACGCYMIRTDAFREIYPDLLIREGRVGQNWQILIPMAGRHKCGYIDEDLYHVILWPNSHSRQGRTLREEVARRLGLKEILQDGIRRSGRTDRDYQKIVDLKYHRILFSVYLNAGAKESALDCYKELEKAGDIQENDRRLYLQHFRPVQYQIYLLRNMALRAARKIKRVLTSQ